MIRFEQVNVSFKQKNQIVNAVSNVSLHIEAGEIFGIVGGSGAGKSTLVRTINGLQKPTSGSVFVEGEDVTKLSSREIRGLRKKIGMIFQHFNLISRKTVGENIEFALKVQDYPKAQRQTRTKELLELVGLEDKENVYPASLSGGQKQRVGIARALAANPKILLCDEATSALDPKITKDILSLLSKINKKLGITIVIVTHQMEVVKEVCEKVALIEGGILKAEGNSEDLFLKPGLSLKKFLGDQDDELLPTTGINIKLFFPSTSSENAIITKMARELNVDFSIVWGKLEKFREDVLGNLVINVEVKDKEKVIEYLESKNVVLEVLN